MNFRIAVHPDLPRLHALIESAYRGDSARGGWTHEADLLDGQRTDLAMLRETIDDPAQTLLVAEEGGNLIGCVAVSRRSCDLAYLGMLTVAPELQRGGLGRQLVEAAETHAREELGSSRIEMTVIRQREELIAWYERLGYGRTGEARPFPLDDPRFGLPRRRDLDFVVLDKQLG